MASVKVESDKAECPECGKTVALYKNGNMYKHKCTSTPMTPQAAPGSLLAPATPPLPPAPKATQASSSSSHPSDRVKAHISDALKNKVADLQSAIEGTNIEAFVHVDTAGEEILTADVIIRIIEGSVGNIIDAITDAVKTGMIDGGIDLIEDSSDAMSHSLGCCLRAFQPATTPETAGTPAEPVAASVESVKREAVKRGKAPAVEPAVEPAVKFVTSRMSAAKYVLINTGPITGQRTIVVSEDRDGKQTGECVCTKNPKNRCITKSNKFYRHECEV